jgi:hypothetical protein
VDHGAVGSLSLRCETHCRVGPRRAVEVCTRVVIDGLKGSTEYRASVAQDAEVRETMVKTKETVLRRAMIMAERKRKRVARAVWFIAARLCRCGAFTEGVME